MGRVGSPEIWEQEGAGRGVWAARAVGELGTGGDSRQGVTEGHRMAEEAGGRLGGCWGTVI